MFLSSALKRTQKAEEIIYLHIIFYDLSLRVNSETIDM